MGELKDNDVDASEIDVDDLFASPSKIPGKDQLDASRTPGVTHGPTDPRPPGGRFDAEESRQAALEAELEGVRNVNKTIEGVVNSLDRAKQNMEMVSRTIASASTLLNTWIRVLSQTEHNQRLILNPAWQGATQDLADLENESVLRQQAAERKEMEAQQRREAAVRRAEEEEQRRRAAESSTTRGTRGAVRGRGRGVERGGSVASSGYGGGSGQSTRGVGRGGGGIGGTGSGASARGNSLIGRAPSSTRTRGRASR